MWLRGTQDCPSSSLRITAITCSRVTKANGHAAQMTQVHDLFASVFELQSVQHEQVTTGSQQERLPHAMRPTYDVNWQRPAQSCVTK